MTVIRHRESSLSRSSYVEQAKELLNELCNLGTAAEKMKSKSERAQPPLFAVDLLELQRMKAKLLQMLQEVDRKYKHYCDQMQAVAGTDAATRCASMGETPRLRILDQKLRQERAFQQMGMVENHPWRPQHRLPEKSVAVLRAWLFEHFLHP